MRIVLCLLLFLIVSVAVAQQSVPSASAPPDPCAVPEQKQLEFWVGEWNLAWPGEKQGELAHGTNSIHRLLDSCFD